MMRTFLRTIWIAFLVPKIWAAPLVSKETIDEEKRLTKLYRLQNQIPVVIRTIADSDLIQMHVLFKSGIRDLDVGSKSLNQLMFATMTSAAKGFPKETVFQTTEKFAIELGCKGGIELASCSLGTINEYWDNALPLFAALIKEPSFTAEDVNLQKQQVIASVKSEMQDPNSMVNDIVNRVFYPKGHPFYHSYEDILKETPLIERENLQELHKRWLNANNMLIAISTSQNTEALLKALNLHFGKIPGQDAKRADVLPSPFDDKSSYIFEDRDIPTAHIAIKFNALGITDKDAPAAKLMIRVLDEELGDEIRTRRSLSYAVYSYTIQYSAGIGIIAASTSKPKETIAAIQEVLDKIKTKEFTRSELDEHKRIYTTSYFLTQEDHNSLNSAIASTFAYFNNTDALYELPAQLDKVTPRDIIDLANELLINFRMGVLFNRKKFEDSWAKEFIEKNIVRPAKKKKKKKK